VNAPEVLNHDDDEEISALLVGRRIVQAELGSFARPEGAGGRVRRDEAQGRLTLDDGTVVLVAPNDGGCSCGAGDYALTMLASWDNVITSVRVAVETDRLEGDLLGEPDQTYVIYVVADAGEINAVQISGNDGNGYYGTGFELIVLRP
jgi:hypothetical protein